MNPAAKGYDRAVDSLLARMSPVLHLTRITGGVAAIGNVWLILLWSRSSPMERDTAPIEVLSRPLWAVLLAGAMAALGLYAFAMAVNGAMDVRRDRALHPDRPLASGRMRMETAIAVIVGSLLIAVLGAIALGTQAVGMAVLTACAIMFHESAAKHIPSTGLVLLGLIYAAHMGIANMSLRFVWPVWLAMTHALAVGAITYRLAERRPPLSGVTFILAGAGWLFWSGVVLAFGWYRTGHLWPREVDPSVLWWIALLVAGFAAIAWWKWRTSRSGRRAADRIQRYGLWWLTLYATAWLWASGHNGPALIMGLLAGLALLMMTTLRELYSLLEHPVGWRKA